MLYQAVFRQYGENIHIPVEADTWEQARRFVQRDNPSLASWPVTVKHVKPGKQAKDDRGELKFDTSRVGRPVEREGVYRKISLEVREDLLAKMDERYQSRRETVEQALNEFLSK